MRPDTKLVPGMMIVYSHSISMGKSTRHTYGLIYSTSDDCSSVSVAWTLDERMFFEDIKRYVFDIPEYALFIVGAESLP